MAKHLANFAKCSKISILTRRLKMEKTYQPQKFESKIYQTWLEKKYFAARPDKNKKKLPKWREKVNLF